MMPPGAAGLPARLPACCLRAEEHLKRLKAEADALDSKQRLRVAQEQLAEYASEKALAAAAILQQAEALEAALGQLLQGVGSGSAAAGVEAAMRQLKGRLSEAALEAQAFSVQQAADVERLKRSSAQVSVCIGGAGGVGCGGGGVVWHLLLGMSPVRQLPVPPSGTPSSFGACSMPACMRQHTRRRGTRACVCCCGAASQTHHMRHTRPSGGAHGCGWCRGAQARARRGGR
jgi:hypothetical protein